MYRIGVDIGGTFTDCVVADEHGLVIATGKAASTPSDPADGVLAVLEVVANQVSLTVEQMLTDTTQFVHGSTVATNSVLERRGPRTGLLTSRGHEDTLVVGRIAQKIAGLSPDQIMDEQQLQKADPPLVARELTVGIIERVDRDGNVVVALDRQNARAQIQHLMDAGVESFAVCLLWSMARPDHEQSVRAVIQELRPGTYVALSSDVAPIIGEYERTVTTTLSAFLGPKVESYLSKLSSRLRERGFVRDLLLVQSTGGLTPPEGLTRNPLLFLDSGPVAGALGGKHFAAEANEPNLILSDMGGTSFDVCVVERGALQLDEMPVIDKYTYLVPKVDVRSIGAGGGSVIWVDETGALRVGPRSAGAQPGPACYGDGGQEPTVTDANLVLGLLNAENFLGGRKRLDRTRAERSLERVGRQLNMSALEIAAGAFRVVNAQMADLIRASTIERGHDPRKFALLAYGGAGPTHAAFLARELKIESVHVPRDASVFCGAGMLATDVLHTYQASCRLALPGERRGLAKVNRTFLTLEEQLRGQFARESTDMSEVTTTRLAYMKYTLQVHELAVTVAQHELTERDIEPLLEEFERGYEAVYGAGTAYRKAGVEIVRCRVEGRRPTPRLQFARNGPGSPDVIAPPLKGYRDVFLIHVGPPAKPSRTPIYDGELLTPGQRLNGPCVLERATDTVVLPAWTRAEVDESASLRIHVA
jgi:N-methylhydantoinase A